MPIAEARKPAAASQKVALCNMPQAAYLFIGDRGEGVGPAGRPLHGWL